MEKDDFTFDKFYALYHKICPRNDIEELFRSITQGKADTINVDQFINFLNEKQRDPRLNEILYPLYDDKRATEIINTYEQSEEARNESELNRLICIPEKSFGLKRPTRLWFHSTNYLKSIE